MPYYLFARPLVLLVPAILIACATQVPVPIIPQVDTRSVLSVEEDEKVERAARSNSQKTVAVPSPPSEASLPAVGDSTSYGVTVSPEIAAAYQNQYTGNNETALAALFEARKKQQGNLNYAFESSLLEAQNLMALGRFDDAENAAKRAERHELKLFKTNVNSRALLGEIKFWASDYDASVLILSKVIAATDAWKLPVRYSGPPTNLPELFNLTTAQLRSYTTLAAIYLARGDFESAQPWANRAELGYADVFYVAHHPLYGAFVPTHADSYYGRALNLAVLGAVTLVVGRDRQSSNTLFKAAHAFLDAIRFVSPKLTVDAIQAQALLASGASAEAAKLSAEISRTAISKGQADLVWRVEMLRGEAFLQEGASEEAEQAFRAAQSAVNVVTGRLTTDRSKRRFGVGKENITYRLAQIDIAKGDMDSLFADLERGRARAFIDMLAQQIVATGRQQNLVTRINSLDRQIRTARLKANAPQQTEERSLQVITKMLKRRADLTGELRSVDPELADIFDVSVQSLSTVQKKLNVGQVLLYTIPSRPDEPIQWLAITQNDAKVEVLQTTHNELRKKLSAYRKLISAGKTSDAAQSTLLDSIGQSLSIQEWIGKSAIRIVPSGQLYFVPWGALGIQAPVSLLPTGGWITRQKNTKAKIGAVIIGDPDFHGTLPQLNGARDEARRIGNQYGTSPLIGSAATEASLRVNVGAGVRMLHIATHAKFDAQRPLNSALFLSGESSADPLTARAIFENPLSAGLVVLSACETGVGQAIADDDFLGLARSFYLGGTQTIINSLWPVDDTGTLAFMTAFHREIGSGNIGAAWLKARDKLKNAGFPPSVYGAFVIGGALKM